MPLSSEDEQRIGNRFNQLINRGNTLLGVLNGNHPIPSYNTVAEYEALVINACNLLETYLVRHRTTSSIKTKSRNGLNHVKQIRFG